MDHSKAEQYLISADKKLKPIIERVGSCRLNHNKRTHFDVLTSSIISQQLSAKAAQTIKSRVMELVGDKTSFKPNSFVNISVSELRKCGLSNSKSNFIKNLANVINNRELNLRGLHAKSDEEVISVLVNQPGIGQWTAEMFMIFSLGRQDILSTTDAGLLRSLQKIYKLQEKPSVEKFITIAEKWRPYRSIASWYLWRALD